MEVTASGRLDALVDATKGSNLLFAFLKRQIEGRALRATGPPTEVLDGKFAVLTLSGLVVDVVDPPRWAPDEVQTALAVPQKYLND